uniref:ATP synthase F0 subunit 8 n=1 Tax=Trimerodytes annularis TaxID=2678873 RepID=UPI0020287090|nr:ATP synthase F0 subunit 8 [Trimerodytes annularis]UQT67995.1 ATP synthase F0 subunit 8 [Trimerodytes annularis]
MPQLDTIFITITFVWTWTTLCLTVKKINTFIMVTGPKKQPSTKNMKQVPVLPWT